MITLKEALYVRNCCYNSIFSNKAEDIYFANTISLCAALGYILKNVKRIDAEIPENFIHQSNITPNYLIANGVTTGGNIMKSAPQLRIYLKTVDNIPPELRARLQQDSNMRITGSLFIEACMQIGFQTGMFQDKNFIKDKILGYFVDVAEQKAFFASYMS